MLRRISDAVLINRLKLRHLQFLIQIDEERSISAVATKTDVSQPAATKLLREIEGILEIKIFERSRHKLEPTHEGQLVLAAARHILAEVRRLSEELTALQEGASGRVVIGALISASSTLLPFSISKLREQSPKVTASILETTEDVLFPELAIGNIDCVLGRLPAHNDPRFDTQELYRERFAIVARRDNPHLSDLANIGSWLPHVEWVLPPKQTQTRQVVEQTLMKQGLGMPRVVAESVAVTVNIRLVQESNAFTAIPYVMGKLYERNKLLALVPGAPELPDTPIGTVIARGRKLTPATRLFLNAVAEVARDMAQEAPGDRGTLDNLTLM